MTRSRKERGSRRKGKKGKWADGEEKTVKRDEVCISGWLHTHVYMGSQYKLDSRL